MIYQLNQHVYWGDWKSPVEAAGVVGAVFNVAHSFSRRRLRNIYWADLERVDWRTFYVRLALKDAMEATPEYCAALEQTALIAKHLGKLPILCHCQMGGHRGPTAAVFVSWVLGGKTRAAYDEACKALRAIKPNWGLGRNKGYFRSLTQHCERSSDA